MAHHTTLIIERDETGRLFEIPIGSWARPWHLGQNNAPKTLPGATPLSPRSGNVTRASFFSVFSDVFLPAGYPASVSPDYLQYQIYNALQAFFNSLAGLLASRGALEGVGVGDASVSATYALLLTVLKDVFSRLTTILGAYYFGTSLYPETKTFRYLADVFNDASTILDTVVPFVGSIDLSKYWIILPSGATLQIIALCLSGGLKSLCSLVAGGSKAALTNHFASPLVGKGDVGEVSAKDASRETVVGLLGMLLGTLFIPYINTRMLTYTTLFILVGTHLLLNYLAVRSVVLRTLNRQRACILWTSFRTREGTLDTKTLTPDRVGSKELLFVAPRTLRDASTGRHLGECLLGTSFRMALSQCTVGHVTSALDVFEHERYVLFVAGGNANRRSQRVVIVACFKEGYRSIDQLQAWVQAIEVARRVYGSRHNSDGDLTDVLRSTLSITRETLPGFIGSLKESGWETGNDSMMFGSPDHLILRTQRDRGDTRGNHEDRKER